MGIRNEKWRFAQSFTLRYESNARSKVCLFMGPASSIYLEIKELFRIRFNLFCIMGERPYRFLRESSFFTVNPIEKYYEGEKAAMSYEHKKKIDDG